MKCPFRFKDDYVGDLEQIMCVTLVHSQTGIALTYNNGDVDTVDFDNKSQCLATFELFCEACTEYSKQQQINRVSK